MRQIFSIRFFAALGAVVGSFIVLASVFGTSEVIDGGAVVSETAPSRRIDFVEHIAFSTDPTFGVDDAGRATGATELVIDEQRRMRIVSGTPGELHCDPSGPADTCAVVADLLGEGVVWFAIVPAGEPGVVDLPAIDTLDAGLATLVNGWQLPYASVLDRRCRQGGRDVEYSSYREFRDELGDDFTTVYDIERRVLAAVVCRSKVSYAP